MRKQTTIRDGTNCFPAKRRVRNERRNSFWWRVTTQIWEVLLIGWSKFHELHDQSEALPRSGKWRVISKEFLRSFLRRHARGNQWWRREMSSVFSGQEWIQHAVFNYPDINNCLMQDFLCFEDFQSLRSRQPSPSLSLSGVPRLLDHHAPGFLSNTTNSGGIPATFSWIPAIGRNLI